LGFPLLLGDWDFFLKFGLKDNLGFVGYGLERGGCYWLLIIMDWLLLAFRGFYGVICCCMGSLLSLVPLGSHYYGL